MTQNIICPLCENTQASVLREYRSTVMPFKDLYLYHCEKCSGVFAYPTPSEEDLKEYYINDYRASGSIHKVKNLYQENRFKIRAQAQWEFIKPYLTNTNSWLDIGAGYGHLLDTVSNHSISQIAAVELDNESRKRLKSQNYEIYDVIEDVDSTFDVISFSHLLEHVASPQEFLGHVTRCLTDNGVVFCEVPNFPGLAEYHPDLPHLLFFDKPSLAQLFTSMGFEILALGTCGPIATQDGERSWKLQQRIMQYLVKLNIPVYLISKFITPAFYRCSATSSEGIWLRLVARIQK